VAFLSWTGREALFGGAGGGGKELPLSTPILTSTGWATIGDLRVGDVIFDHDGEPTVVTHLHDIEYVEAYRVKMVDGEEIFACADHLWNVASAQQRMNWRRTDPRWQATRRSQRKSRGRTETERLLVSDGRAHGTALAATERNARVATLEREVTERPSLWDYTTTMTTVEVMALAATEREKVAIPCGGPLRTTGEWQSAIPPYTLGAWLGDGTAATGHISVCEADRKDFVSELEADGWQVQAVQTAAKEGLQPFHRLTLTRNGVTLRTSLGTEGLLGNKHVPAWVHTAPHADRQAFIAGFFDTDGTIDKTRGRVEFCLAREDMVRDVHSLLWGLGESPTPVTERTTRNQCEGFTGRAWRFQITGAGPGLFRLPRKRALLPEHRSASNEYRMIASIEATGVTVPMRCITVDNNRGLYRVAASHLVTHNSIALLMAALQFADIPGYNAVIFRRALTDLELPDGLIDVSKDWLDQTDAQWNGNKRRWTFPSGAVLQFAYMSAYGSERRYKSTQFQFIGFDEITEFPWEEQYLYLFSRLRRGVRDTQQAISVYGQSPDGVTLADIPLRVRSATNPGGPGHSWVYHRFVDKSNTERRPFLPSLLSDNPGIDADEYRAALAELPEVERRRMEEGDWDVVEIPGALWKFADLVHDEAEIPKQGTDIDVRAVAIDPSVSKEGDECGILVGSITGGVVTAEVDLSGNYHPDDWAKQAVLAYHEYGATRLVCEDNQGGSLVFSAVGNAADLLGMPRPNVVRVRAKESKEARAIPVAVSYRAGKVRHLSGLRSGKLEAQMTSWIPGMTSKSPDRVDAVVWLVRHLLFREGDVVEYHTSSAREKLTTARDSGTALRHRSQALRSGLVRPADRMRRL
jgi:hypothetical protein